MRCEICGELPSDVGGLVLAQHGTERTLCETCSALHPTQGKGFKFIPVGEEEEEDGEN